MVEIDKIYQKAYDLSYQLTPFLLPKENNNNILQDTKNSIKQIHDILIDANQKDKSFQSIYIDNMDDQQIWYQLNKNINNVIKVVEKDINKLQKPKKQNKKQKNNKQIEKDIEDEENIDEYDENELLDDEDQDLDQEEDLEDEELDDERDDEENLDDLEEDNEQFDNNKKNKKDDRSNNNQEDQIDEKIDYADLEKYLNEADNFDFNKLNDNKKSKKSKNKKTMNNEEESDFDEDEDEDLDEEIGLSEDIDDEDEDIHYEDFFGGKAQKKVKKNFDNDDYEDDEEEKVDEGENDNEDIDEEVEDDEDEIFEEAREVELENEKKEKGEENDQDNNDQKQDKKKNKLDSEIDKLENKLINKKSWQLGGEIRAHERPKNSLLQEALDFKSGIKVDQEVLPEKNINLEERIKQRILDEAYDDPQNYQLPVNFQENFNNLNEINFEKSQQGLAEQYEDSFKKNILNLPTTNADDNNKKEIELLFKKICFNLDSLSNLNFTPKPYINEKANIVTNISSIQREEKIPIFMSTAQQMAPQELFQAKKAKFQEKEDMTTEDNKKARKQLKRNLRTRIKEKIAKGKIKKLDQMGQTKFQYNAVQKGKSKLKQEVKTKNQSSIKFTKSNQFFKNLNNQNGQKNKKEETEAPNKKNYKL